MSENPPLKVLTRARALIDQGWIQGDYYGYEDDEDFNAEPISFCSLGAIEQALTKTLEEDHSIKWLDTKVDAQNYLLRVIHREGDTADGIAEWNDAEGRTKDEVLAAFDKAIELSKGSEA